MAVTGDAKLPPWFGPAPVGDPLGLRGTRVIVMKATEWPGEVLDTCRDRDGSEHAFIRLDARCTGWFALEDVEPDEDPPAPPDPYSELDFT